MERKVYVYKLKQCEDIKAYFTAIIAFNITHGPAFIYNNVSETGLYLRPQVRNRLGWAKSIELVPISGHQNQGEGERERK
jgi:hypothetical protein